MNQFYLEPTIGQKSFYGKAKVIETKDRRTLRSYSTDVCSIDNQGQFCRLWGGYSATTLRHINSFLDSYGMGKMTKRQWEELEVEGE